MPFTHQPALLDRTIHLARLHPDAQRRHPQALPHGIGRQAGNRATMKFLARNWMKGLVAVALVPFGNTAPEAGDLEPFGGGYPTGSIVIVTHQRQLFCVLDRGRAISYPVGVGKEGMAWHGRASVAEKHVRPAWRKPPSTNGRRYGPIIPGGAPRNPRGAAVLGLSRGNYAIHGHPNAKQRRDRPLPTCADRHSRHRIAVTGASPSAAATINLCTDSCFSAKARDPDTIHRQESRHGASAHIAPAGSSRARSPQDRRRYS
jgi:hypothetical protein